MSQQHFSFPGDDRPGFKRQGDFFEQKGDEDNNKGQLKGAGRQSEKKIDKPRKGAGAVEKAETGGEPTVYSVTQVTRLIKLTLNVHLPGQVIVMGELSGWRPVGSGHIYPRLKDEQAVLEAVMWRSDAAKLKFRPTDGMMVIARGRLDFFPPSGRCQLYIDKLEPAGTGALELAFQQLKERLQKEGLFDEGRKRAVPFFPETVGIVTSPVGQAIQDIERTLQQRMPGVRKLLMGVRVQGEAAAGEIAAAVRAFNERARRERVDVLIVGRGGGSLEDLWPFNEEVVARAIYASRIPVISAVGHEGDVTIADLVADVRAATPTAAAVRAVPDRVELLEQVALWRRQLTGAARKATGQGRERLRQWERHLLWRRAAALLVHPRGQLLDQEAGRLGQGVKEMVGRRVTMLQGWREMMGRIEPHRLLREARERLEGAGYRSEAVMKRLTAARGQELNGLTMRLRDQSPRHRIAGEGAMLAERGKAMARAQQRLMEARQRDVRERSGRLSSLNPRAVLKRGYSITRNERGELITGAEMPGVGELLRTELGQGQVESRVTKISETEASHDEKESG